MKHKWITAIYGFAIGAAMIVTWIVMLVPGGTKVGLELGFHIAAELLTAALMIVAGILTLKKIKADRIWGFFSLGMLVPATLGAFVEYVVNLEWLISVSSAATFVITLLLVILNYEKLKDLTFLTLGIVLYACLNIGGEALESVIQGQVAQPLWGTLTYISLAFVSGMVLFILKVTKKRKV